MRRPRCLPGQSMVEFALIAPLMFALLFAIIELGLLMNIYISLTNSAREGARAGAVYMYDAPGNTPVINAATIDTQRELYITNTISGTLNPLISTTALTTTVGYSTDTSLAENPYRAREYVTVALAHDHSLFFGLFGSQKYTLSANSTMRIEPGSVR